MAELVTRRIRHGSRHAVHPTAERAEEVLVAAPMIACHHAVDGRLKAAEPLVALVSHLLDAAIAQEAAEDEGIGNGRGSENLEAGPQAAQLLASVGGNNGLDPVGGDGDERQRECKQQAQSDFAFGGHGAPYDDGQRECHEGYVRDNVCHTHGDDLSEAVAAVGAGVWNDLPVVRKGMTLCESDNDDSKEGEGEEPADRSKGALIGMCPDRAGDASEELQYGILGGPDASQPFVSKASSCVLNSG